MGDEHRAQAAAGERTLSPLEGLVGPPDDQGKRLNAITAVSLAPGTTRRAGRFWTILRTNLRAIADLWPPTTVDHQSGGRMKRSTE